MTNKMLILRGNSARAGIYPDEEGRNIAWPNGALHVNAASEYAKSRRFEPIVLDVPGQPQGQRSPQAKAALKKFFDDSEIKALYGFSGGAYNVRHILEYLASNKPEALRRIILIVVLGAPLLPKALFESSRYNNIVKGDHHPDWTPVNWEVVYGTNPPQSALPKGLPKGTGTHMFGPDVLLAGGWVDRLTDEKFAAIVGSSDPDAPPGRSKGAAETPARKRTTKPPAPKGAGKKGEATEQATKKATAKKPAAKKVARPVSAPPAATERSVRTAVNGDLSIHEMQRFALARHAAALRRKDRPTGLGAGNGRPSRNHLVRPGPERASSSKRASVKKSARAPARVRRHPAGPKAAGSDRAAARAKPKPRVTVADGRNTPPPKAAAEIVECSVFGPPAAPPGKTILIQVFLHLADQAERARFLATSMDASAKVKAAKPLDLPVRRGARVEIAFNASGLVVDEPVQSVVWQGEPTFCQFLTTIPAGTSGQSFFPLIRVTVDGKLIGRIAFSLSSDDAASQPASEPLGDHAKLYKYAFVSYASKDREEVLKRVQMLEVLKTKFFHDILSLDPGDRWEKKLYENIDRCDLFLLFWSQAARDSQWVLKEAEYALAHQLKDSGREPDLVPVVLEQNVPPPPSLSAFHFNDRISYLISRKA